MMPRELAGKSAIVTGSTSGLGLGIARAFAAAGMDVALNGFGDPAEIEAMRSGIEREFAAKAVFSNADMAKPDDIVRLAEEAERAFGHIDVLVNNAGIQHVEAVEKFPPEKWDAIIAINLSSAFHGIRAVLGGMKERRWGRIINIASAHGLVASPYKVAYVSAKHGLIGLVKTLALEGAEHGIRATAVCPSYVRTPLVENQITAQAEAHGMPEERVLEEVILAPQAIKELLEPADVADVVAFLLGPGGRAFTGTAVTLDSGWTAR